MNAWLRQRLMALPKDEQDEIIDSLDDVQAKAIRTMLEATKEHMVLKDIEGEGYLSTKVIKAHANGLEKINGKPPLKI